MLILGSLVWQAYNERLARAQATSAANVNLVAVQTRWVVETSAQLLLRIQDRFDSGDLTITDAEIHHLDQHVRELPDHLRISIYDAAGNLTLTNAERSVGYNIADREYFSRLAGGESFVISSLLRDRATGENGFVIARRLEGAGAFLGVAAISVNNSMFEEYWHLLGIPPGGTISVVTVDGWLAARYPPVEEPLYVGDRELFTRHLASAPSGTYFSAASPIDNEPRIVAYRAIDGVPLIAISAISTREIAAGLWVSTLIVLGLLLPLAVGLLLALFWMGRLVRDKEAARQKLETTLDHNKLLFRELHHRVKNNLQAVASLIRLQDQPEAQKEEMSRRLGAMIAVHEHIYKTDQFQTVDVSGYIRRLICEIAESFDLAATVKIDQSIETIVVDRDQVLPIGLIINEVLSNAFKYAFQGRESGTIEISLREIEDGRLAKLIIADNGNGYDAHTVRRGMGSRLIEGLSAQAGGTIHISSDNGTVFEFRFPTATSVPE
ncbi:sensor histidine kinase [Pelagibacterium limicola]|uniref:sensor histidine kinase n=1 Tax=Pelagibacterium limicola TaxID=2791022 RepID=UPI0018B01009|nr:histidine kinase dimerization/phosphoacceptor domain -containing protein [Pelagibacterium limicola]